MARGAGVPVLPGLAVTVLLLLATSPAAAGAALDPEARRQASVFVEAEDFAPVGNDWRPGDGWADDIYDATSGNAVLANDGGQGEARRDVVIPAAGTYNAWVRYLKIGDYKGSFGLRILQGGQTVFEHVYRTTPTGGDWRGLWETFAAPLNAGPATLVLYLAVPGIRQRLDCVLLTPDLTYEPDYRDFAPRAFLRFRLLDPAVPVTVHLRTYIHRAPIYYHDPGLVTSAGLGAAGAPIAAGAWSPWFDLSRYMDAGKWQTTVKCAYATEGKPLAHVKAEYQLAPAADEAQARTLAEDIDGDLSSLVLPGDLQRFPEVVTLASALSAAHLERARALGLPPPPDTAGLIPLEVGIWGFGDSYRSQRVLAAEMEVARILGVNTLNDLYGVRRLLAAGLGIRRSFLSQWVPYQAWACPTAAQLPELMDQHFAKAAADIRQEDPEALALCQRNILQDEPGTSSLAHLQDCPSCTGAFRQYLQQQGLAPADVGLPDWARAKPIPREQATDLPSRRLHYASIQFRDLTNAGLVRQGRLAAEKHLGPHILNCVNFTDGALSGWDAALANGPDWFLYGRTQAVSLLWSEDWGSLGPEVSGYIVDMLRAAARPAGLPVGEYIICNHVPTLEQRAFSALIHGAKTLHFYCYGPYFAFADGMVSDNLDVQRVLGRTLRDIAAADRYLQPARVEPAQVAILYGKSHEIWQDEAAVGTERRTLYLACQHAHVPVDMLSEDDLVDGVLSSYRVLYLTESNLRRAAAAQIVAWVNHGGILQMSAGSARADEFNEPMAELLDLAGVRVNAVDKPKGDYREHFGIPYQNPRGEIALAAGPLWPACTLPLLGYAEDAVAAGAEVLATFADGKPAICRRQAGRGTVLRFAFMPGLGYVRAAGPQPDQVITGYRPEQLPVLTAAITLAGIVAPISLSEPLVEAQLLRGPQADVIPLANWTLRTLDSLRVTVRNAAGIRTVESTRGVPLATSVQGADLLVSGPLEAADVWVLQR
jgi:hypothetical protein